MTPNNVRRCETIATQAGEGSHPRLTHWRTMEMTNSTAPRFIDRRPTCRFAACAYGRAPPPERTHRARVANNASTLIGLSM